MSPLSPHRVVRLILCLAFVAGAAAAPSATATDAEPGTTPAVAPAAIDPPGFVIVQIDGLAEPVLRTALGSGVMPFVAGLIHDGSHTLGSWRTTAASTTTVTQAGLLHGSWEGIPGFRWWDREAGQLVDFLDREDARHFEESIDGPLDLLADDGASVTNLYAGGADHVVLTATHLDGPRLAWEVARYVADLPKVRHAVIGFGEGAVADVMRLIRGQAAPLDPGNVKRKAPVPVIGPALEWALVDVTAAAVVRELQQGTPLLYATFTTYDEVAHYAGPEHAAATGALRHIDDALRWIAATAGEAGLPYHLVVLSDHGQTDGRPFALRYGETLTEVVRGLLSDGPASPGEADGVDGSGSGHAGLPDLVVAASGNLAHVYFPRQARRLHADEIEALHPGLIAGLVSHPGVGIVVVRTGDGELRALGPGGRQELLGGTIEGQDPLGHYGPLGAISLRNIAAAPDAGDLVVVSMYDPAANEVASFEPQVGSHGGIGGPQMEPFLLYPSELVGADAPLALEGVDALRATIGAWLGPRAPLAAGGAGMTVADGGAGADARAAEPSSAYLGEETCLTAEVPGGRGEVCARRDGFGAAWRLELVDTDDDGRDVRATIGLEVEEGPDQSAELENDLGAGRSRITSDRFSPRVGAAIGDISIRTCVVIRFGPDRCRTRSATLPQLTGRATPQQRARLEQLVFEEPIDTFMATWRHDVRVGPDESFDWSTDGCSAGPFADLFDERLKAACIRHDFAYRNFGQLLLDPTDEVRRRVDEQLARDARALGESRLATGIEESLRRFGGPVFYGDDLATAWDVPAFLLPDATTD